MARAFPTLAKLQGTRFTGIQKSALEYLPALPPCKAETFEDIKAKAALLLTPIIIDDQRPWSAASVTITCSSGTVVFTTVFTSAASTVTKTLLVSEGLE